MNTFDTVSGRALELADTVGNHLRHVLPEAGKWLEAGVKIGALRTGVKAAGTVVRRHPVVAVATVAGIGLLWWAARRKLRQERNQTQIAQGEVIEGSARQVEAKRNDTARRRRTAARKRAPRAAATKSD
jgi:hypothetical protein